MAYKFAVHDKGKFSEWFRPNRKDFKFMCCDCGLTHNVEYGKDRAGKLRTKWSRDNRKTAAYRRYNPPTI